MSYDNLSDNRWSHLEDFLCPNTTELLLQGKGDSSVFKYIEIKIHGCELEESLCKSLSEVDNTHLDFTQLSNRVDFSEFNYNSVLKEQQSEKQILVLDSSKNQKFNNYYTKSTITLSDSHWKLFGLFTRAYELYEKVSEYKYYEVNDPE